MTDSHSSMKPEMKPEIIGRVANITKFGLYIQFDEPDDMEATEKSASATFDETVKNISGKKNEKSRKTGLLRWSNLPKGLPKFQKGDWIGLAVDKIHDDGKIDLTYVEKDFKQVYGKILQSSQLEIDRLQEKNASIR